MSICKESKVLLIYGLCAAALLRFYARILPSLAGSVTEAIRYLRVCRCTGDVAVGILLVCLIGAIAFDIGKRMQ